MMWVAIATAMMMSSGDGDDFRPAFQVVASMRAALESADVEGTHRRGATAALNEIEGSLLAYRDALVAYVACLEVADRSYEATRRDYDACVAGFAASFEDVLPRYVSARAGFDEALTDAERHAVQEAATAWLRREASR